MAGLVALLNEIVHVCLCHRGTNKISIVSAIIISRNNFLHNNNSMNSGQRTMLLNVVMKNVTIS